MKSVSPLLAVTVSLMVVLSYGLAYAQRSGSSGGGHYRAGGNTGGYYRSGGNVGGYYRDGEHYGDHGHGGDHHDQYRSNFDVVIGGYWGWDPWWGWGYPTPYYYPYYSYSPYYPYGYYYDYYPYYAPQTIVPQAPSYIERGESESSPTSSRWPEDWFFCPGSRSFYPYVKECPGGWETVPSTPPADSGPISTSKPSKSSAPSGVWYYCPGSKSYYPYVRKCPGGWNTVPAKPAGPER